MDREFHRKNEQSEKHHHFRLFLQSRWAKLGTAVNRKDIVLFLVLLTAAFECFAQDAARDLGETVWVKVPDGRLKTRVYKSARLDRRPILLVVLHGDLPTPPPSYQYEFAKDIAMSNRNVVAAGVLRPAYTDETGDRSDGEPFLGTGDNYTPNVVDAVALAIENLKSRYTARSVVVVGHSGGATIAAVLLGRHPDIANAAVLVACGCDPIDWRRRMLMEQRDPVWEGATGSLSPLDQSSAVRQTALVELLVGSEDTTAPIKYSQAYAAVLRERGVNARVQELPALGHNILFAPAVINTTAELIARLR